MDKQLLTELKNKLIEQQDKIKNQLTKFADKDKKLDHDWDTRFPNFTSNETGSGALEQAAEEVEEYSSLLPIEYNLELELKNIGIALAKIEAGTYGTCENCQGEIEIERLKAYPAARNCLSCHNSKEN